VQLFQPYHYAAFDPPKPTQDDPVTVSERIRVRDALLRLDEMLWPAISRAGWDLHHHRQRTHYVSSDHFITLDDGTQVVNFIDGMWLHYGKSPNQLDYIKLQVGGYDYKRRDDDEYYNAFYLHTRIQFYLNNQVFRAWLLLATDKNYYDRSEFLKRLDKSPAAKEELFRLIQPLLDRDFFYEIDGERFNLQSGVTQELLVRFVRRDRPGFYSGIVKEYAPNGPLLDESRIAEEMIKNLGLLYPIYNFMAYRFDARPRAT
jgi:hypothetical protein